MHQWNLSKQKETWVSQRYSRALQAAGTSPAYGIRTTWTQNNSNLKRWKPKNTKNKQQPFLFANRATSENMDERNGKCPSRIHPLSTNNSTTMSYFHFWKNSAWIMCKVQRSKMCKVESKMNPWIYGPILIMSTIPWSSTSSTRRLSGSRPFWKQLFHFSKCFQRQTPKNLVSEFNQKAVKTSTKMITHSKLRLERFKAAARPGQVPLGWRSETFPISTQRIHFTTSSNNFPMPKCPTKCGACKRKSGTTNQKLRACTPFSHWQIRLAKIATKTNQNEDSKGNLHRCDWDLICNEHLYGSVCWHVKHATEIYSKEIFKTAALKRRLVHSWDHTDLTHHISPKSQFVSNNDSRRDIQPSNLKQGASDSNLAKRIQRTCHVLWKFLSRSFK